MADEDIESGGQTDDTGDTGGDEPDEGPADAEPRQARDGGEPAARPPRKERRAHVMREAAEAKARAEREAAETRQRYEQTQQELRELRQQVEESKRSTQSQDKQTQTLNKVGELRRLAKMQLGLSAQFGAKGDAAAAEKAWDEYQRLNDEAEDLRDELRAEKRWEKQRGELQQGMPNQSLMEDKLYLSGKYPWLESSHEGRSLADGRYRALVNAGRPQTRQTLEEAITYAAKLLRLGGGNGAPSDASRMRYEGRGQRDGEHDEGSGNGFMSVEEVKNNLHFKKLAQLSYPELDPEQAYVKWAKKEGSAAKRDAG